MTHESLLSRPFLGQLTQHLEHPYTLSQKLEQYGSCKKSIVAMVLFGQAQKQISARFKPLSQEKLQKLYYMFFHFEV